MQNSLHVFSIFLITLFITLFTVSFTPTNLSACSTAQDGIYDNCTNSVWDGGNKTFTRNSLIVRNNSATTFNSRVSAPTLNINVFNKSSLDFRIAGNNGTSNLNFTVGDNTSAITYRGGTSGVVRATLNDCTDVNCFRTNSDITSVDMNSGGWFTVGIGNTAANVIVNTIEGNGAINLVDGSSLIINSYMYDDSDDSKAINFIRGNGSYLTVNSGIFINELSINGASFNGFAKLLNINNSGSTGNIIFNGESDIASINNSDNLIFNNNSTIGEINNSGTITAQNGETTTININNLNSLSRLSISNSNVNVENLGYLGEANLNDNSTLYILGSSDGNINSVHGRGTLQIDGSSTKFHINNINLANLVFNEGELVLEKDFIGEYHVINNITRS
ncbi:MAG: hypothetical protein LBH40_02825, partial [Alphaproteobacteria bacterium]|nr:hypothetical protein [Alphaproteobacteria bacterium]